MKAIATTKVLRKGALVQPGTPFEIAESEVARAAKLGWKLVPEEAKGEDSGNNNIPPEVKTERIPENTNGDSPVTPKAPAKAAPAQAKTVKKA